MLGHLFLCVCVYENIFICSIVGMRLIAYFDVNKKM